MGFVWFGVGDRGEGKAVGIWGRVRVLLVVWTGLMRISWMNVLLISLILCMNSFLIISIIMLSLTWALALIIPPTLNITLPFTPIQLILINRPNSSPPVPFPMQLTLHEPSPSLHTNLFLQFPNFGLFFLILNLQFLHLLLQYRQCLLYLFVIS